MDDSPDGNLFNMHKLAQRLERERDAALALVTELREALKGANAEKARLLAALQEIADIPAVAFVRDQMQMATRTIDRMSEIARAALNADEGKESK